MKKPIVKVQTELDKQLTNLRDYLEGNQTEFKLDPDLDSLKLEVASFTRLMIKKYMSRLIKLGEKLETLEDELLSNANFSNFIEQVEFYNGLVQAYNSVFNNLKSLVPILKELSKLSQSVELRVVETEEDSSILEQLEINQETRNTLKEILSSVVEHLEV